MHAVFTLAESSRALAVKRWGYLIFLLVASLPPAGWLLGRLTGLADLFSFHTLVVVFGIVPLVDRRGHQQSVAVRGGCPRA
jgi:hypothetical protein